jgi:hypothetical protein
LIRSIQNNHILKGEFMKKVVICLGLMALLTGAAFNLTYGQSDKPQVPGAVYTGDAVPTVGIIAENYLHLGPDFKHIQVIGIHKINEVEYKIISTQTGGKTAVSDMIYDLWKLESKEWVMVRPNTPVTQYVKVLYH